MWGMKQMSRMISIQGLLAVLFSGATFYSIGDANLSQVTQFEDVSVEHRLKFAREILARDARFYLNHRTENIRSLSQYIFEITRDRTPDQSLAPRITKAIAHESKRYAIDPLFLTALIEQESHFSTQVVGRHGEIGLMQIKPVTARWIAKKAHLPWKGESSLYQPEWNLRYGVAYLMYLRNHTKNAGVLGYVDAYNMGQGQLLKRLQSGIKVPSSYSTSIRQRFGRYYARLDLKLRKSEASLRPLLQERYALAISAQYGR